MIRLPITPLKELEKYSNWGQFMFTTTDSLSKVCNAPDKYGGLYLIYAIRNNTSELLYVGISGRVERLSGKLIARKDGIRGRIVNGKRDGQLRRNFWLREMNQEKFEALNIYWYVINDENTFLDCPETLEKVIKNKYKPRWNRK